MLKQTSLRWARWAAHDDHRLATLCARHCADWRASWAEVSFITPPQAQSSCGRRRLRSYGLASPSLAWCSALLDRLEHGPEGALQ
jgi:hypothetical protein